MQRRSISTAQYIAMFLKVCFRILPYGQVVLPLRLFTVVPSKKLSMPSLQISIVQEKGGKKKKVTKIMPE